MNLLILRRVFRTRWHLLGCALCLPVLGFAQALPSATPAAAPSNSAATSPGDQDKPGDEPVYRFEIELLTEPKELREFLLRHMELQRFRTLPDLDASELARLVDKAPDNIGDLLGTLGHFNPKVEVLGLESTIGGPLGTVRLKVDPGPLTQVESVLIAFRGDIAERPEAAAQRAAIRNAFSMKAGDRFTQADWDSAKTAALRELTARRYPAGRIDGSLADIDPSNHTVRLALELDSGLPVQIGEVRVEGTERYDAAAATNLVRLSGLVTGSDYDLANLQEVQRRIASTGYYDSVFVSVDPGTDAQVAPVVVQVRESKRQKLVLGVGGSTDSGARLSIEHTHNRVPGVGWRAVNKLLLERDNQLFSTDWIRPINEAGWNTFTALKLERQVDGFDTTTSQRLRLGQSQSRLEQDRSYFLQFDRALSTNSQDATLGSDGAQSALSINYDWTRRRFNDLLQPNDGHGWAVELGAGTTLSPIRRPFTRTRVRWLGLWPIAAGQPTTDQTTASALGEAKRTPVSGSAGRLALRLEGGAVLAQADTPVPETQLFLTGGDNTVRGYSARSIGVPQSDGGVQPGRYLAVTSLEWQRPWVSNGVRTPFETVLFVDGGAVANKTGDLNMKWGVGAGLRYKSPVGPLQVDLAYGLDTRRFRLHLNVGFTF